MEVICNNYMPGDSRLVEQLVSELKSQGIFDQFRKECISDVDTKPAYQNLRQRVEGTVTTFLNQQAWSIDLNKNQLREQLRKNLHESGFLETGVERIVDQVVNPKISTVFLPKVEDVVYRFLGIERPAGRIVIKKEEKKVSITDLLPTDLEAVSPESVDSFKTEKKNDSLHDSLPSSGKMDEDESPPFEPLGIQNSHENSMSQDDTKMQIDENSRDSHLSGFSGLESHESNPGSDTKTCQMELSNQDSLNSIETRLSIITSEDTTKMEIFEDSTAEIKNDKPEITSDEVDTVNGGENAITVVTDVKKEEPINNDIINDKIDEPEKKDRKHEDKKQDDKKSRSSDKSKDRKDDKHKRSSSSKDKEKSSSKHKDLKDKDANKKDSKSSSSSSHRDKDRSKERSSDSKDKDKSSKYKDKNEKSKHEKDKTTEKSKSEKESANKDEKYRDKNKQDKNKYEKDKSSSRDKDKYKSDKDRHSKDKEKSKHKDKNDKERSSNSKERSDRDKDKNSKEKSSKDKDNAAVKERIKDNDKDSSKDKMKHSSSNSSSSGSKHSSSKDKKKEKSKDSTTKNSVDDSKSKSSSSDKHKKEDKHSSGKKDHKDSKKKSKDDHYSSKIKKSDRRSTDRDSNDGTSSKNNNNSLNNYSESMSSKSENNSQEQSNSSFSGGSGDSGNSDQVELVTRNAVEISVGNGCVQAEQSFVPMQVQPMKYMKPKFASNFEEARKIMKIRKQLARMERQNQLSLTRIDVPHIENGIAVKEDDNIVIKDRLPNNVEVNKVQKMDLLSNESVKEKASNITDNLVRISEHSIITSANEDRKNLERDARKEMAIESTNLSMENFEALEAKLAQVMSKINYNSYESDEDYEFHGYSSADLLYSVPNQAYNLQFANTEMELMNYRLDKDNDQFKPSTNSRASVESNRDSVYSILDDRLSLEPDNHQLNNVRQLSVVINTPKNDIIKNNDDCLYLEKPTVSEENNLKFLRQIISKLQTEINNAVETTRNNFWPLNRGRKRKLDECVDFRNNNDIGYVTTVNKRRESTSSNTVTPKAIKKRMCNNTDIPDEHFSLPLSPAESDKSNDRKEEDLLIPMKQKRIIRGYSQRYSSEDLYKPRPIIGRRNRFPKNTN